MNGRPPTPRPYDWRRQRPQVEVPRPEVGPVSDALERGDSYVLLAGRGMGKSVFLYQLQKEFEKRPNVRVVHFTEPPLRLTVETCLEALSYALDVSPRRMGTVSDVIGTYFETAERPNLVLLFDEFDRYARVDGDPENPPGRDFFNSLESMHRVFPGVGILAAGSIGAFVFRDILGSGFLDRADILLIPPFSREQIEGLARPFAQRGRPLPMETLEALALASGGNPALLTYGLGSLWALEEPHEHDVVAVFTDFQVKNREFVRDFQLSFLSSRLSEAPRRVWDIIRSSDGKLDHCDLVAACGPPKPPLLLSFTDVLTLLQAAGLVSIEGSSLSDPVLVRPISSILSLPRAASARRERSLGERFSEDLLILLNRLHVSSTDFFRPGTRGESKRLVPESVFSGFLALGLNLLGWQVEREAQRAAGRTDLIARRAGSNADALVEVKIWGRKGYAEVASQITGYWTAETRAGAVVMLTDAEIEDWPQRYRERCLAGAEIDSLAGESGSPIRARFRVLGETSNGMSTPVEHFLLRLPRRRLSKPPGKRRLV